MAELKVEKTDEALIFHAEGEIEIETSSNFKSFIREQLQSEKFDTVIVDLEKVTYIDSSGLGAIIAIAKDCRINASKLKLINVPDIVFHVLKLTRLDMIIDIER
jgi:anti-sigma B factor antagonist